MGLGVYGGNRPSQPHCDIRDRQVIKLMLNNRQERIRDIQLMPHFPPDGFTHCSRSHLFTFFTLIFIFIVYLFFAYSELKRAVDFSYSYSICFSKLIFYLIYTFLSS